MHPAEAEVQGARRQLEQVLESTLFARSERLSRFLRFTVERHLEGRDHELKESVIAVEVFGRMPGYNPKHDPIVRTEARRLRARLGEYYKDEGKGDALVIELRKGGYTPVFRRREARRKERKTQLWATVALAAAALAVAGCWWVLHKSGPVPIAVLPLTNLSPDPSNDYFVDGLTGEIIRNLSIIDGLAVRSQTSSFVFKGKPRNVREAGKQLEADYILEGSVLRAGDKLRINTQLVRVRDDFPLWSGRFDREITDIFAIQDEISQGIVNSLRLKLGGGRRRYETSTEAYDFYLRARALEVKRGVARFRDSIRPYEDAIAKDPSFAPAHAGLAAVYAVRTSQFPFLDHQAEELAKMRVAAAKAIQLDPLLAEAHDALGMVYARDGQWEQSEKSLRRAIQLDPGRSMSYSRLALYLLLPLGRIGEAVHWLHIAEKADRLSAEIQFDLGYILISADRYEEASGHCQKLPADYPDKRQCLGRARFGQGKTDEAIQLLATDRLIDRGFLGYVYGRAGRREEAKALAAAVSQEPLPQAVVFAGLGDKDRTLVALERTTPLGPFRLGGVLTYPELTLVRGDPRVKTLRKKVGLPE